MTFLFQGPRPSWLQSQPTPFAGQVLRLLLAGVLLASCDSSLAADKNEAEPAQDEPQDLARTMTVKVTAQDLVSSIRVPGSVRALESAELYAKLGGFLESMEVDIGDRVQKGQLLAVISVPEMEPELRRHEAAVALAREQVDLQTAAVAQARAALASAKADENRVQVARGEKDANLALQQAEFERWTLLLEQSPSIERRKLDESRYRLAAATSGLALSDADEVAARLLSAEAAAALETAQAEERVARARVPLAEASLATTQALMGYAQIKAPFAGRITERHVHPGAFIRPAATSGDSSPLLCLQRVERVRVSIHLPMDSVASLNPGDRVLFENLAVAPGATFEGSITRIAGALGERSRMMRAEVEFDNPENEQGLRQLQPGAYGDLTVFLEEHPQTPTVPASAVFSSEGELSVFVVLEGRAQRRAITAIFQDGQRVGVGSGLRVGEEVISVGVHSITNGERVQTQPDARGGN